MSVHKELPYSFFFFLQPHNTPLCGSPVVYLTNSLLMHICSDSRLLLLQALL